MLRRSVESALTSRIGVADQAVEAHLPRPSRHVEGIDDERGGHGAAGLPSDEAAREHVDDEGDVDDARPRRAVGEVGDPELVGGGGQELSFDEVRCSKVTGVSMGGEALLGPGGPVDPLALHQSLDLVSAQVESSTLGRLGQLAPSIDRVGALPERFQRWAHLGVSRRSG